MQLFVENFKKFLAKEEQSQVLQPVARYEIYEPPSVTSILVADTDTPRHRWQLGVVTELIVGADSLCRAAVVRTSKGCTTRSIVKLYPLEVQAGSHSTPEENTEKNEEHSNENSMWKTKAIWNSLPDNIVNQCNSESFHSLCRNHFSKR